MCENCKSVADLHFVKTVYLLCENYVFSYREQMGWFYAEEIGADSVYLSEIHWDRRLFLVRKFVSKKKNEGNGEGNPSHFSLR